MTAPQDGPKRVGEVLEALLDKRPVGRELRRIEVLDHWPSRVGAKIAEVTRARSVTGGTLVVEVRSSAWLTELNLMKSEILQRLNEGRDRDVGIEKLVFVLADI